MLQAKFLIALCISAGVYATILETVPDEELLNLIKTEKYVVVLFSKSVCFFLQSFLNGASRSYVQSACDFMS